MIDRRLIGIASDPERLTALTLLSERSAGAGEVADKLQIELAAAGQLLDKMHDAGLIEVAGEALSNGAVEQRYRAAVRVFWGDEDCMELGEEERERLAEWIIGMINADFREALEGRTFVARQDSHASRTVPLVDEQGWEELHDIHDDALNAILAVKAASAERLAEKGEPGIPVLSAMLCCELPKPEDRQAG